MFRRELRAPGTWAAGPHTFAQSPGGWKRGRSGAGGVFDKVRCSPRFPGGAGGSATSLCRVPAHPAVVLSCSTHRRRWTAGQGVPASPLLPALWPDHQLLLRDLSPLRHLEAQVGPDRWGAHIDASETGFALWP